MIDLLVRPEGPLAVGTDRRASIVARPGGSAANQAAWLARFGVAVALVGRIGACDHAEQTAPGVVMNVRPRFIRIIRSTKL